MTPDEYLFKGNLLRVTVRRVDVNADPVYDCEEIDRTWMLNRMGGVWGRWRNDPAYRRASLKTHPDCPGP